MCAVLRLLREIKVMHAEKMKMEILRREKKMSRPHPQGKALTAAVSLVKSSYDWC